jgi:hypothetical protein
MNVSRVTLSQTDVDKLQAKLDAALDIYRGRSSTESVIDTLELSKSAACVDLASEDVFKEYIKDYETASVDFVFSYPGFGDVRVRVSTVNGSIWIRTAVREEIVDHVFEAVRSVKGLK